MEPIENEFQIVAEIKSATDIDKLRELTLDLYFHNCHLRQFFKDAIARFPGDFKPDTYEKLLGDSHHEHK